MPRVAGARERFEVNAAICELEMADGLRSVELVELTHYQNHRYSLVIMTAAEARDLARLLAAAADECTPWPKSQERGGPKPANPNPQAVE